MKRYLTIASALGAVFFCAGIGFGFWNKKKQADVLAHSQPLRVLCAEDWLSNDTLERFSLKHNVRIQQFTYARPSEFLRQLANADGNVDVICANSMLVKSLIQSHWIQKSNFSNLRNSSLVSVDFTHLPYDPNDEYTVPLFWNLLGFIGKGDPPDDLNWKQIWASKKIALWGDELNTLFIMGKLGLNIEQRMDEEPDRKTGKTVDDDIRKMSQSGMRFLKPSLTEITDESALAGSDWVEVPVAHVARLLASQKDLHFWLPEDGAVMSLGVLAVGGKAAQPELALQLINDLVSSQHALEAHQRLNAGVVHRSLSGLSTIPDLQKSEALRKFPLNRLQFPDLSLDALPRFEKIFDETIASKY